MSEESIAKIRKVHHELIELLNKVVTYDLDIANETLYLSI